MEKSTVAHLFSRIDSFVPKAKECSWSISIQNCGSDIRFERRHVFFGGIDLYSVHWVIMMSRILALAGFPGAMHIPISFTKPTMVIYIVKSD